MRPFRLPRVPTILLATAALTAVLVPVGGAAAASNPGTCGVVDADWEVSSQVEPDRTALFEEYGNSGAGWTGGDSTYSVRLPGGRTVWMFSDTFLGPVNPDLTRPIETPFLNNSFVVQRGGSLTTVTGGTPAEPDSLVPPDQPNTWNWLGAGIATPRSFDVMFLQFGTFGSGMWDFEWQANKLVRFDPWTFEVQDVVPMPSDAGVQWASWIQRDGRHTYVYGVDDQGATKHMHLARVRGTDVTAEWEYWTGSGWSSHETDSVAIMPGVANEYSVTRFQGGYLLVTQDTNELFSSNIVGYVSCTPWGPFVPVGTLYQTPETGGNTITYNAHEHPEQRRGNTLIVTYNVNSLDSSELYDDVTIYRPRFVEVELSRVE
ncbi:DUF4185 domain-containing protein [Phytoactinopolyspora limicola]|uniref:DUF4185 domain-containing protein n=1 Tax=Phytoactinopolyspora limicola TaxID=2715536 RepID=UPI00140E8B77|nr:DUF4185 domain-containing protein [Phytoactinopolyspora limicola]